MIAAKLSTAGGAFPGLTYLKIHGGVKKSQTGRKKLCKFLQLGEMLGMEKHPRLDLIPVIREIEDPRMDRTRLHNLVDILVISICALLCGAESFEDMAEWHLVLLRHKIFSRCGWILRLRESMSTCLRRCLRASAFCTSCSVA